MRDMAHSRLSGSRSTPACLPVRLLLSAVVLTGLLAPTALFAQEIAHGRVQVDFYTSPSYPASGCNGGPYTALFDVQILLQPGSGGGNTWEEIVTNIINNVQQGAPFDNATGGITGTVQMTGGCVGSYTVDPNSFGWYMEFDSNGTWHFYFSYLLIGSDLTAGVNFNSVTVDTMNVAGSTIANDPSNNSNISGGIICLSSSPTLLCITTLPLITSLSATSVPAGSSGFALTLNGSNFTTGVGVNWTENGQTTSLSTQLVNSTTITAQVPANLLMVPGTAQITVENPGGGPSAPQTFTITSPGGGSNPTLVTDVISNTNGIVNNACVTPPSLTSFTTGSPQVWVYFSVTGATVGDTATINFVRPDGVIYEADNPSVAYTSECFSYFIGISGAPAASYPGTWTVQVFLESVHDASLLSELHVVRAGPGHQPVSNFRHRWNRRVHPHCERNQLRLGGRRSMERQCTPHHVCKLHSIDGVRECRPDRLGWNGLDYGVQRRSDFWGRFVYDQCSFWQLGPDASNGRHFEYERNREQYVRDPSLSHEFHDILAAGLGLLLCDRCERRGFSHHQFLAPRRSRLWNL